MPQNQTNIAESPASPFPYKHWWGLLGCAAIMGVILLMAPYSEGIDFVPDQPVDWW